MYNIKSLKENFPNFFGEDANRAYSEYLKYYTEYTYNKVFPMENANEFLKLCNQKKRLVIIPNAGHGVAYLVDPDKYIQEFEDFVK